MSWKRLKNTAASINGPGAVERSRSDQAHTVDQQVNEGRHHARAQIAAWVTVGERGGFGR